MKEYKGFAIVKNNSNWEIWLNGACLRTTKTLKEAMQRIDEQTV